MAETDAEMVVSRARKFLNEFNEHPDDTVNTGKYLVKFAQTQLDNIRIMVTRHLFLTKKGLFHFKTSPLKMWHRISFDDGKTCSHAYVDFDKFPSKKEVGWRKPTSMELDNCFSEMLINMLHWKFDDGTYIRPTQLRSLLYLAGMRIDRRFIPYLKSFKRRALESVDNADPSIFHEVCREFYSLNRILHQHADPFWSSILMFVKTEDLRVDEPLLCSVIEYKRSITDPERSVELGHDEKFESLQDDQEIAVYNDARWHEVTPQNFVEYISSLLFYLGYLTV